MYSVKVERLSKHYQVYKKPFDRLKEAVMRRAFHEIVEALRQVSFEVPSGDTLGIIGENGAGKSTLLKILAGTVRPTEGNVTKQGRTAALLELGSGFHPEFSGRENIYLNAALLGLSDAEIRAREQEIIEFSDLRGVIDRPVRTYSSGMYVRLGFSIATSVNPDVLIIDEALSVGDQRFQQKCIERMIGFKNANKTIILCSHSMYLIRELCAKTLWLRDGRLCSEGKTSDVISHYLAYLESDANGKSTNQDHSERPHHPEITIESVSILDQNRRPFCDINQFQNVIIHVKTQRKGHPLKGHLAVSIGQSEDHPIFETTTKICGMEPIEFTGDQITELFIPSIPIQGGAYRVRAKVGDEFALRSIDEMNSEPFLIKSNRPEIGVLWMEHHWRVT